MMTMDVLVDADKVEPALLVELPDKAVEHALLEVPLEPRVVVVDDLGLAAQLVPEVDGKLYLANSNK